MDFESHKNLSNILIILSQSQRFALIFITYGTFKKERPLSRRRKVLGKAYTTCHRYSKNSGRWTDRSKIFERHHIQKDEIIYFFDAIGLQGKSLIAPRTTFSCPNFNISCSHWSIAFLWKYFFFSFLCINEDSIAKTLLVHGCFFSRSFIFFLFRLTQSVPSGCNTFKVVSVRFVQLSILLGC